jgi:hypothetical protein
MKLALHVLLLAALAWGCAFAQEKVTVVVPSQTSPRVLYGAERLVKALGGKAVLAKTDTAPTENAITIGKLKEDRLISDTVARLHARLPRGENLRQRRACAGFVGASQLEVGNPG